MPKTILFQLGKLRSEKPKIKGDKINHAPITIKTINVHFIFLLYQNYKKEKREYRTRRVHRVQLREIHWLNKKRMVKLKKKVGKIN
jgi:hypothetical protein